MSIIKTPIGEDGCILPDINVFSRSKLYCDVGSFCSHYGEQHLGVFSKMYICGLCNISLHFIKEISSDLEQFASHGKRSTINYNDIKLFLRRNDKILKYVSKEYSSSKK